MIWRLWPFGRNSKPSEQEYVLGIDQSEDGDRSQVCEVEKGSNGGIKIKGVRAEKMREIDKAQEEFCADIDRTISRLRRVTEKLRAVKTKRREEPA